LAGDVTFRREPGPASLFSLRDFRAERKLPDILLCCPNFGATAMATRYHAAAKLLNASAESRRRRRRPPPRTTSGLYASKLESVVGGLRSWLLQFASLLLHRLVEEHRFAVLLAEAEDGAVYMTRDPEAEDPDEEREGRDIARWSREDIGRIKSHIRVRGAKVKDLESSMDDLASAVERSSGWLVKAIPAYAAHMKKLDEISADQASRERKEADRDPNLRSPGFDADAPPVKWSRRDLFPAKPEANDWTLRQWANIYKHGPGPGQLKPMALDREAHMAASLLERRTVELKSKSLEAWSRDVAVDEDGDPHPAFLSAVWRFLVACKAAIAEDDRKVAEEWNFIDEESRAVGVTASRTKVKDRDWTVFRGVRSKHTFEERIERKKRKYKRDKRGRFVK